MDPLAVLRTIWRQKWFALPAIAIAVAAAAFVYVEGPRTYDSTQSFALANPKVPTEKEIDADPALLELNSDNPYLRSSDPNLVANVVITRLNAQETQDRLAELSLSTDYTVNSGALGGGLVVSVAAAGETPAAAVQAVDELGALLTSYLREVQTVNGADERFLFTAITVSAPSTPTEQLSSRLRTVIVVGIAGVILVFAAVSLGTWIDNIRARRAMRAARPHNESAEPETSPVAVDKPKRAPRARYAPHGASALIRSEARGRHP